MYRYRLSFEPLCDLIVQLQLCRQDISGIPGFSQSQAY